MLLSLPLLLVYPYVIKYKVFPKYHPLAWCAAFAGLYDILVNYTEWWILFGRPQKGHYTISKRLKWMKDHAFFESQREFAKLVYVYLDAFEEDGEH